MLDDKQQSYVWSTAATLFFLSAVFEAIYPWQTDRRLTNIGPEYSPYVMAGSALFCALMMCAIAYMCHLTDKLKNGRYRSVNDSPDSEISTGSGGSVPGSASSHSTKRSDRSEGSVFERYFSDFRVRIRNFGSHTTSPVSHSGGRLPGIVEDGSPGNTGSPAGSLNTSQHDDSDLEKTPDMPTSTTKKDKKEGTGSRSSSPSNLN